MHCAGKNTLYTAYCTYLELSELTAEVIHSPGMLLIQLVCLRAVLVTLGLILDSQLIQKGLPLLCHLLHLLQALDLLVAVLLQCVQLLDGFRVVLSALL